MPPVANAGPDQTITDADSSGSEVVTLDGSAALPLSTVFSQQGNSLREFLLQDGCERACIFGIEPGMSTAQLEAILVTNSIEYELNEIEIEDAVIATVYYVYISLPNELVVHNAGLPISIAIDIGAIAQLLVPVEVSIANILDAFGNPSFVGQEDHSYIVGYPELGLFFHFVGESLSTSLEAALRTPEASQEFLAMPLVSPCTEPTEFCRLVALLTTPAGPDQTVTDADSSDSEPYVLFVGLENSPFGVFPYRMNPDGSNRQLFESDQLDYSRLAGAMEVSPDGRTLAYTSGDEEKGNTIYLLDLADGTSSELPLDTDSNASPRWSPDGQTIAYLADGLNGDLNAVDLSTGQTRELLNARIFYQMFGRTGRVKGFDWSPDGSQLVAGMVFDPTPESSPYSGLGMILVNADGSNPHPVMAPELPGSSPTWGHDADLIYYVCKRPLAEICVLDLTTFQIMQTSHFSDVFGDSDYHIADLDISPDNQIVFEFYDRTLPLHETPDIYRFDVATGEWANLTLDPDIELYDPRWVYPPAVPPVANAGPDQTVTDADSSGSEPGR